MIIQIEEYIDETGWSTFGEWFDGLSAAAAAKVTVAIDRIGRGLLGDVKSVGQGVSERRIDFGPGYRVYFGSIKEGNAIRIVILLGGGTKKCQRKDIQVAQSQWKACKARRRQGEQ
jgi:putative addiction module killer protein